MNFIIKTLLRTAAIALAAFLPCAVSTAQQAVLSGTAEWTGAADSDYFNAANWLNGILPSGVTDIRLPSEPANKTLEITHNGTENRQVDVYSIRTGLNYAYNINLLSTNSGTLTYNITGRGAHPFNTDGDSTSTGNAANRLLFYIGMGNNTRITFAEDIYDAGGVPLNARDTSGLLYAWINMTGNAVIDARTMDNSINISDAASATPGTISWGGSVRLGAFNIGPDAVVYLGMSAGHLGAALGTGMEERWEGLLIQDEWDPAKLRSDLYGKTLPDGVTTDMLTLPATNQNTQKWGTGITRVTTTGTVLHPGTMIIRGANGGYIVDGYHKGPISFNVSGNTGGYVGGKGRIDGNVTVTPNSSITGGDRGGAGNLTVTGSLILNGALSIDLVEWTEYDHLQINGDLDIGSTGNLAVGRSDEFPLQPGTFRVLDYTGALTGDFNSTVLPQSQGLAASWAWVGKGLELTFTQLAFGDNPNLTGDYHTIAVHLDNAAAAGVVPGTLFDTLNRQPSLAYFQQVLDQITPVTYQAWYPSAVLRTNSMVQSIEDRLMQDAGYGRARRSTQTYIQGWRQESSRDRDVLAAYSNYDTSAVLAGVDYALAENTVIGGYLAYETTEYDLDVYGGTGKGKGLTIGAYARHNPGNWQFNGVALFGADDYSAHRNVAMTRLGTWVDADTDGTRYGAAVSAAYTIKFPWLEVAPVLGAQWLSWKADGFNEIGFTDESMNLAVKSQSETSLQARLGVRFSRAFESSRGFIRPYLHMAYVREFETGERDMTADLLGESLTIKVPGIEANGLRVDAGIDWDVTKAIRAGVRYTAQYNNACDESMGVRAIISFAF
jgi:uncharacterized protein with beta-barrel porin domain